jgi:thymidylate synthase (FAD)
MCKLKIDVKLPIFIARQWIRHRMQNINEVSARYTELPGEFYIPTKWRKNLDKGKNKQQSEISEELDHEGLTKKVECFCEESYNQYKSLLKDGVAKEMARMVLPLNIYTQWISCWDLKNLLHFITLRDDAHAQAEIQEYSKAIKQILKELFPWTMEVYEKYKFVLQENKI